MLRLRCLGTFLLILSVTGCTPPVRDEPEQPVHADKEAWKPPALPTDREAASRKDPSDPKSDNQLEPVKALNSPLLPRQSFEKAKIQLFVSKPVRDGRAIQGVTVIASDSWLAGKRYIATSFDPIPELHRRLYGLSDDTLYEVVVFLLENGIDQLPSRTPQQMDFTVMAAPDYGGTILVTQIRPGKNYILVEEDMSGPQVAQFKKLTRGVKDIMEALGDKNSLVHWETEAFSDFFRRKIGEEKGAKK